VRFEVLQEVEPALGEGHRQPAGGAVDARDRTVPGGSGGDQRAQPGPLLRVEARDPVGEHGLSHGRPRPPRSRAWPAAPAFPPKGTADRRWPWRSRGWWAGG